LHCTGFSFNYGGFITWLDLNVASTTQRRATAATIKLRNQREMIRTTYVSPTGSRKTGGASPQHPTRLALLSSNGAPLGSPSSPLCDGFKMGFRERLTCAKKVNTRLLSLSLRVPVENDVLKEFTIADSETLETVNRCGLAWPEWETSSTAASTITPLFNRGDWDPGWICRIPSSTSGASIRGRNGLIINRRQVPIN
jgi:hypothetical protein